MRRLALKSMARSPWPEGERTWPKCWYRPWDDPELASLAVRFTLSQDIHAMLTPGQFELFRMALDIADNFRPLEPEEYERVRALATANEPIFAD